MKTTNEPTTTSGAQKLFGALFIWTMFGTMASITRLLDGFPQSSWLWPTMVTPQWLGVLIGTGVLVILYGLNVLAAPDDAQPKAVDQEMQAARQRVAAVLRARVAQQRDDQRPE